MKPFLHINRYVAQRSLAKTLALTMLFISTFTLVVVSSAAIYFTYQSQREAVGSQQTLAAQNAANGVKSFVQDKFGTLHSSARFNYASGIPTTDSTSTLQKLLGLEPAFNQVALLDANQREVGNASRLPDLYASSITAPINKSQLFQAMRQSKDFISDVYIDKGSSEPEVLLAVPIDSVYSGFSGTLVAETNLKFMWDIVGNIKDGDHGVGYVVDEHGNLIAAGDTTRVLKRENLSKLNEVKQFLARDSSIKDSGTDNSIGFNGTKVVSTYATLGTPNWAVVTEIPVSEAYAPVIRSLIISTALILAGIATSIIASFWIARRLTKPILELRDTTRRLGDGDLSARANTGSKDEVGELAIAFNTMTEGLQGTTRRLQEEHSRLEASINSLNVGLLMTFVGTKSLSYNPAALDILGIQSDTLKLNSAPDFTVELLHTLVKGFDVGTAINKAQNEGLSFRDTQVPYGNKIISFSGTPITSGDKRILGAVVLLEDITETKVMERSKDEFFSIASHELRTPLTSIKGNAAMIMEYYAEQLKDPDLKEMIGDIRISSERLIEIVNDFLDLSRLEQGKVVFKNEEFSLEEIVESVVYEMKAVLAQKKLHLTFDRLTLDGLPKVWADKNRVKQVVYNLVGNASKFTEVGGITISAKLEGKQIKVLVSDTGRGIPAEGQKMLFHKFQQASNSLLTRDTTRGTGLGLYISKMLIENMGGHVNLEHSELGKGTTFSFTLPIATDELKATDAATPSDETDSRTGLSVQK